MARITPTSAVLNKFGKAAGFTLAGIVTLGAAVAAGQLVQRSAQSVDNAHPNPHAFDSERRILFDANPGGGDVRALGLRAGISNLSVLKAPERHMVRDLRFDPSRRWLWVLGDDAVYRYDAYSMKEDGRFPLPDGEATKFSSVSRVSFALEPIVMNAALESEVRRVR